MGYEFKQKTLSNDGVWNPPFNPHRLYDEKEGRERKQCIYCGKTIMRRDFFIINWGKKIKFSKKVWERKKHCTTQCAKNHSAYKRRIKNPEPFKKAYKKFKEKHPMYSKERREFIKKNNPDKYHKILLKEKNYRKENKEKINIRSLERIKKIKQEILTRYSNKCAFCDENKVLDIHHIDEDKKHQNDFTKRVIVLCPTHHRYYHDGIYTKEKIESKYIKMGDTK